MDLLTAGNTQFKAQLTKFNGKLYVGLSKYYLHPETQEWLPTRKHFFMPAGVYKAIAITKIPLITRAVRDIESQGMIS